MQIVIDIDEEIYKKCKWKNNGVVGLEWWERAIANGTPLPKGHGRFIDADALIEKYGNKADFIVGRIGDTYLNPTVLEADRE